MWVQVLLVSLSLFHLGRLQSESPSEETLSDVGAAFDHLKSRMATIENGTDVLVEEFRQFKGEVLYELRSLRNNITRLDDLVHVCGGTGWRRVAYLDMTDLRATCPSGWNMTDYSRRTCGRASSGWYTQDSVFFPVGGEQYRRVCGRIKAYQWGVATAFGHTFANSINGTYVTGVSVTHGKDRKHIWTFAAGINEVPTIMCPCVDDLIATLPPQFVGRDYFCESGLSMQQGSADMPLAVDDPLWDGRISNPTGRCFNHFPYFIKYLDTPTTEDIELRICNVFPSPTGANGFTRESDIAVEQLELHIQ